MNRKWSYLILQSVLILALAALLAFFTISIYQEGMARREDNALEDVFKPQEVREKLSHAAPLAFFLIGMSAAGLLLDVKDERAKRPVRDAKAARDLVAGRIAKPSAAMEKERRFQKATLILGWSLFWACMVPIGLYLAREGHFYEDDLEGMLRSLALAVFPWAGAGILVLWVTFVRIQKSQIKETNLAKERLTQEKKEGLSPLERGSRKEKPVLFWQLALLAAALFFIVMGVKNRSALDVFVKAAKICTECIGLG